MKTLIAAAVIILTFTSALSWATQLPMTQTRTAFAYGMGTLSSACTRAASTAMNSLRSYCQLHLNGALMDANFKNTCHVTAASPPHDFVRACAVTCTPDCEY